MGRTWIRRRRRAPLGAKRAAPASKRSAAGSLARKRSAAGAPARKRPAAGALRSLLFAAALLAALALAACGGSSTASGGGGGDGSGGSLTLVAYSTPEEAYRELIPAFNETPEGEGVSFDQSYASSGEQSRAVEGGLPADVVEFSLEPDMTRLVEAGLVDQDWNRNEHNGMVTDSVVVFMVRKGNPENIRTWDDLIRDGIEVIEPNPFTSGGAKWNIMAAYGAQLEQGRSTEEARAYLEQLFTHVPVLDKSARESLQTFSSGKGDVLLGYENEAILAQQSGEEIDYVVPDQTILIENPVAVVNESENVVAAQAFVDFLYTQEAQRIFADKGYRPVVEGIESKHDFPTPPNLFEITKFGGWDKVNEEFFDPESGVVAEIFQSQGKSTASG
jgi:sulfate/thiosulfate transport system substrate-binding protein